jgi:predicted transcriptional regulator
MSRDNIRDRFLSIVVYPWPLYHNQMKQTRVSYEANLTHPQTVKYLRELVDLGLIILTNFKPYNNIEDACDQDEV